MDDDKQQQYLSSLKEDIIDEGSDVGSREFREWIDNWPQETFYGEQIYKDLQNLTKPYKTLQLKTRLYTFLTRECQAGRIQSVSGRTGLYRKVAGTFEVLDFFNAPDKPLSIKLPMQMNELGLRIWQKDLMGIAGVSGDGKSAWFVSLIEKNMREWDILYLSRGDMCATNLKERMKKSDTPLSEWQKYMGGKMINIYGEFADFIKPNAINIIDFMHDAEAFRHSHLMLGIKNKLNNGVAFIALQKNKGAEYGVGRESSMYYTSTYMTIDSGVAKILKARSFIGEWGNPVGKQFQFKLVNGVTFMPDKEGVGEWYRPSDLPVGHNIGNKPYYRSNK